MTDQSKQGERQRLIKALSDSIAMMGERVASHKDARDSEYNECELKQRLWCETVNAAIPVLQNHIAALTEPEVPAHLAQRVEAFIADYAQPFDDSHGYKRTAIELHELRTFCAELIAAAVRNGELTEMIFHNSTKKLLSNARQEVEAARAAGEAAIAELAKVREELAITEKLLVEREKVLHAIPECPDHGYCVPHAVEWVIAARRGYSAARAEGYERGRREAWKEISPDYVSGVINNNQRGHDVILRPRDDVTIPVATMMIACPHPDLSDDCCIWCGMSMRIHELAKAAQAEGGE